jgi:hypothetical protein
MRWQRWFFVGLMLLWASVGQAAELVITTPPLIGRRSTCMVASLTERAPLLLTLELVNGDGVVLASGDSFIPAPFGITLIVVDTGESTDRPHYCRMTTADAHKGELKVTYCTPSAGSPTCQAAVTAQ